MNCLNQVTYPEDFSGLLRLGARGTSARDHCERSSDEIPISILISVPAVILLAP